MARRRVVAQAALAQFGAAGLVRQLLPLVIAAGLIWYLSQHLADVDLGRISTALGSISPQQWLLAALATAVSFWAVGHYDFVVHRLFGSAVPPSQARRAGIVAIALSQTVGMGLLTGALVRWRMLPALSLWQCTQLSLAVALSFLAGWAVVASAAIVLLPMAPVIPGLALAAALVLLMAAAFLGAALLRPAFLAQWPIPPFRSLIRVVALAAVDTCAAALAFAVLMPEAASLSLLLLLPAFLLALGVGLVTGTPGGVGPFEAMLLTLLPQAEPEPLLAGILAFRLVYYALPAVLAAIAAIIGPRQAENDRPERGHPAPLLRASLTGDLLSSAPAEAQLVHQGPFALWSGQGGNTGWLLAETANSLVTLGDPIGTADKALLVAPRLMAAQRDRGLAHYKCSAETAALLRRAGYRVVRTGSEARIDPARFTLDLPERAGLRRLLRKADRAGLVCTSQEGPGLASADLAAVSAAWVARHGAERGFSMGRFHPDHLQGQRLFLAHVGPRLVGFVSFHTTGRDWALDLMRSVDDAPAGTMHSLIVAAIRAAAAEGVTLSLAAVAAERPGMLCRLIDRATGAAGLRQFKSAFAPDWRPLYLAAPGRLALVLATLDIAWAICHPGPLQPPQPRARLQPQFLASWHRW